MTLMEEELVDIKINEVLTERETLLDDIRFRRKPDFIVRPVYINLNRNDWVTLYKVMPNGEEFGLVSFNMKEK